MPSYRCIEKLTLFNAQYQCLFPSEITCSPYRYVTGCHHAPHSLKRFKLYMLQLRTSIAKQDTVGLGKCDEVIYWQQHGGNLTLIWIAFKTMRANDSNECRQKLHDLLHNAWHACVCVFVRLCQFLHGSGLDVWDLYHYVDKIRIDVRLLLVLQGCLILFFQVGRECSVSRLRFCWKWFHFS